jgi:hypothetical protein
MSKRLSSLLLGATALWIASVASATGTTALDPVFNINGNQIDNEALNCSGDGKQICRGDELELGGFSLLDWQFALDPDPSVIQLFAIQNNTAAAQSFVFSALLPVPAQGPQLTISGSVGGSITDTNGDGATLTDNGSPIYTSIIDGAFVETLLDPPQSYSAGAFGSEVIGPAAFAPTLFAGPVNTFIGVTIQFTLSPGDIVSFTSVFNVEPIPEPGTLLLLGSGVLGLTAFGRRTA